MRRHWIIPQLTLACLGFGCSCAPPPVENDRRVGTFDRKQLLVAFYRSQHWNETLRQWQRQRDEARTRGDLEQVARIEARGQASQKRAHRQLAGKEPLDNVLEVLEPAIRELRAELDLQAIVEAPKRAHRNTLAVDVTEQLIKHLPPAKREQQ